MNILVIAPHADDEVLGCGGLIARRAAAGAWVHVAVLGLGGVKQRGTTIQSSLIVVRERELHRAAEVLGVQKTTVLFEGRDMRMDTEPMLNVVTALDGLLDDMAYDEVYLPYASVNHDHQVTYRAMLAALRPATGRPAPPFVAAYEYALIGWQLEAVPAAGCTWISVRRWRRSWRRWTRIRRSCEPFRIPVRRRPCGRWRAIEAWKPA